MKREKEWTLNVFNVLFLIGPPLGRLRPRTDCPVDVDASGVSSLVLVLSSAFRERKR